MTDLQDPAGLFGWVVRDTLRCFQDVPRRWSMIFVRSPFPLTWQADEAIRDRITWK